MVDYCFVRDERPRGVSEKLWDRFASGSFRGTIYDRKPNWFRIRRRKSRKHPPIKKKKRATWLPSRSEAEFSIALHRAVSGYPLESINNLLYQNAGPWSKVSEIKRRSPARAASYVADTVQAAVRMAAETHHPRQLSEFERLVERDPSLPAAGKAVIMALSAIARRTGRFKFHASVREVAALAGVGTTTAARYLKSDLPQYFKKIGDASPAAGTLYQLQAPSQKHYRPAGSCPLFDRERHFFLHLHRGGHTAHAIYRFLLRGDRTEDSEGATFKAGEIARALGTSARTVRRHLARLTLDGLVVRSERGGYRVSGIPRETQLEEAERVEASRLASLRRQVSRHGQRIRDWVEWQNEHGWPEGKRPKRNILTT